MQTQQEYQQRYELQRREEQQRASYHKPHNFLNNENHQKNNRNDVSEIRPLKNQNLLKMNYSNYNTYQNPQNLMSTPNALISTTSVIFLSEAQLNSQTVEFRNNTIFLKNQNKKNNIREPITSYTLTTPLLKFNDIINKKNNEKFKPIKYKNNRILDNYPARNSFNNLTTQVNFLHILFIALSYF